MEKINLGPAAEVTFFSFVLSGYFPAVSPQGMIYGPSGSSLDGNNKLALQVQDEKTMLWRNTDIVPS